MKEEFSKNVELDAQLAIASHKFDNDDAAFEVRFKELGIPDASTGMRRAMWVCQQDREYINSVRARFRELGKVEGIDDIEDIIAYPRAKGDHSIVIERGNLEKIAAMGLDPTEEMLDFVNRICEDAKVGGPLSKPYIDADVIRVVVHPVEPFGRFRGVIIDNEKFGEMVRNPKSHSA